jgi:TfoX/Sxy family transcriptional regulator of competence genes
MSKSAAAARYPSQSTPVEAPMAWTKSPPELIERFRMVAPGGPLAVEKQMFGYPAAFVNGHMFLGLHQSDLILRLSAEAQVEARAAGATDFTPMEGRPMRNFVTLPAAIIADDAAFRSWVGRAYAETAAMPPKEAKPAKPRKTAANRA